MKKIIEMKLPPFYNYKEEKTDSGYETMQDFILSWTLRCSVEEYSTINEKLQKYSKGVLISLIFGDNNEKWDYELSKSVSDYDIIVKSVGTKRQWNLIDLLVEIQLEINGETKFYILNIENKWYSSIREGQLEKSKKHIEDHYNDSKYNLKNLIIFCDYEKLNQETKIFCKEIGYKIIVIKDLWELSEMKSENLTGNYLFDEYWFRF
jgi:hypothetical protein